MARHNTCEVFVLLYEVLLMFKLFCLVSLKVTEKAIGSSELHLTPNNDGESDSTRHSPIDIRKKKGILFGDGMAFLLQCGWMYVIDSSLTIHNCRSCQKFWPSKLRKER